jgi:hypothetical protein
MYMVYEYFFETATRYHRILRNKQAFLRHTGSLTIHSLNCFWSVNSLSRCHSYMYNLLYDLLIIWFRIYKILYSPVTHLFSLFRINCLTILCNLIYNEYLNRNNNYPKLFLPFCLHYLLL